MKKDYTRFTLIIVMILFLILPLTTQSVSAATEDYAAVVKNAPEGLDISKYFDVGKFKLNSSQDTNYPFTVNSSSIYQDATNSKSGKILNLAKGSSPGKVGAAWSNNDQSDNYIDITKKQTVSVWLYFGSGDDSATTNGEGISLVLQNDERGTSSMGAAYQGLGVLGYDNSRLNAKSALGITTLNSPTINTPEQAAKTAVQNSIALNFHGQSNNLNSGSEPAEPLLVGGTPQSSIFGVKSWQNLYTLNSYDTDKSNVSAPKNYPEYDNLMRNDTLGNSKLILGNTGSSYGIISMTYPSLPLTYYDMELSSIRGDGKLDPLTAARGLWTNINPGNNGHALSTFQVGAKRAYLINATDNHKQPIYWHHLTFTWNPAKGNEPATMEYEYNDKFLDGTMNSGQSSDYQEVTETIPVDPSVFNNPIDNKVYWGLTGANSNDDGVFSKLAVFESIPALATASVKTTLTDSTLGKTITDDSTTNDLSKTGSTISDTDNNVYNGDDLSFDYNLSWDADSRQAWKDIVGNIDLPTDVTYKSAIVTYHGPNGDSSPITITDANGLTKSTLEYKLQDLGNASGATTNKYTSADIVLNGQANNEATTPITVDPQVAKFTGSNAIETTSTPKFVINGKVVPKTELSMNVSPNLTFQSVNYKSTTQYLKRTTDFDLSVTSLKEPWTLSVSSNGLSNGTDDFNGNIVYKRSATETPIVLSDTIQPVESETESHNTTTTDNIADDWTSDTGLLLEPDADDMNSAGQYVGKLSWTVTSSL